MAGVRGCLRGVALITPHPALRDNPVDAYGRSNDIIAAAFLGMRCQTVVLFSPPREGFPVLDDPCQLLRENTREHVEQERQEVDVSGLRMTLMPSALADVRSVRTMESPSSVRQQYHGSARVVV